MWRRVVLTTAIAAAAIGTAGIVAACSGAHGDEQAAGTVEASPAAVTASVADQSAPAELGGDVTEGEAVAIQAIGPRVIHTATLSLTVGRGGFEEAVARARTITTGLGGFVTSSSASQGDGSRLVRGTIVLRVPAQAYARAMTALADLGRVEGREEVGEDVSAQVVDLKARTRHLEAVEAQLLRFLDRTRTVGEALAVQQRLADVQLQLEEARGQLRYLSDQTTFATITLDVAERGVPTTAPPSDDGFGIADAWHAALHGLETVTAGAFVALMTAGPVLLLLGGAFLGGRLVLRRRRVRTAGATGSSAPTPTPPA